MKKRFLDQGLFSILLHKKFKNNSTFSILTTIPHISEVERYDTWFYFTPSILYARNVLGTGDLNRRMDWGIYIRWFFFSIEFVYSSQELDASDFYKKYMPSFYMRGKEEDK